VNEGNLLGGLVEVGILGGLPVVSNMVSWSVLYWAEPLGTPVSCSSCQLNTSPVTTPTPTATKNSRSMPATYTPYLDGAESSLSQSIMTVPASPPILAATYCRKGSGSCSASSSLRSGRAK
jgi:hypothetical protein